MLAPFSRKGPNKTWSKAPCLSSQPALPLQPCFLPTQTGVEPSLADASDMSELNLRAWNEWGWSFSSVLLGLFLWSARDPGYHGGSPPLSAPEIQCLERQTEWGHSLLYLTHFPTFYTSWLSLLAFFLLEWRLRAKLIGFWDLGWAECEIRVTWKMGFF